MNREMLKECIADAKTIRETAIASAKVALEEAFTPQLTAMFAERLNELEVEEEMKEESVDEMYGMEEEGLEEDFNLEELLAELSKEDNEDSEMKKEGMKQELDEDLMLEEMSDEEIEELVMQVIDDMIASGKLMPGEGEEEGEEDMEDMEDMDDMGSEEDMEAEEEVDIDEILAEMEDKEELEEGVLDDPATLELVGQIASVLKMSPEGVMQMIAALPAVVVGAAFAKSPVKDLIKKVKDKIGNKTSQDEAMETEATNAEMEETINELRKELNEVNLLNAKLLYTNKIFKSKNLTESEKIKVLNTFDKAETVKEVKLVFETLTESFKVTTAKKNQIKESLGSASKTISTATPKQPIIEANEAFARMQRLAGLRK
jgi:hypothetical protein